MSTQQDDFALPAAILPSPYTTARIAWELDQVALGVAYYPTALRIAKSTQALTSDERDCLDRWLAGYERGVEDRMALQDIAVKVRAQAL